VPDRIALDRDRAARLQANGHIRLDLPPHLAVVEVDQHATFGDVAGARDFRVERQQRLRSPRRSCAAWNPRTRRPGAILV
jgi:hypothetical protein